MIALLAVGAGAGAGTLFAQTLVEHDARAVGEVFGGLITRHLPASFFESAGPDEGRRYTGVIRTIAGSGQVLRVSLYDRRGVVLWSDDVSRIGQSFAHDPHVRRALAGKPHAEIVPAKTALGAPAAAPSADRVQEFELPIRYSPDGPVAGVLQVYREAPGLLAAVDRSEMVSWTVGRGGALLSLMLVGIMLGARPRLRLRAGTAAPGRPEPPPGTAALHGLNGVREEEARRIAHALHDASGQLLASVHLALDQWSKELPQQSPERLRHVTDLLDQVETRLRDISHELRPTILDDLGVVPALEVLADNVSKRSGLRVSVDAAGAGRFEPAVETALYRVAQEALTNVVRHARATSVDIRLEHADGIVQCSIEDDGVGFDARAVASDGHAGGLGLLGIRERVASLDGTVSIDAVPGLGTRVAVSIPVER